MSVHYVYKRDGGAKMMRPVHNREEYLALRNGRCQVVYMRRIRAGEEHLKSELVQMNYSCLPNPDGTLKGSKTMSTTVGMDIDHLSPDEMPVVRERILNKKDELGLLMLEESARGGGYHLVFKRRPDLSQEANLKWASDLLEVAYDSQAKDITRVFFTTSGDQLIYLDDAIFEIQEADLILATDYRTNRTLISGTVPKTNPSAGSGTVSETVSAKQFPTDYHGIPFSVIIKKYWEVNNRGFEPTEGDRDTLTYQLACDLRHICGRSFEWLDQVIPCYDGFPLEEKRAKIKSALASEFNGFPVRLRNVLNLLAARAPLACYRRDARTDYRTDRTGFSEQGLSPMCDEESSGPLQEKLPKMPMGIKESIDAVGPQLAMPVVTAICPCIGTLATGVTLDVHGQKKGLNLISYIAGDFASGKGGIDPVVEAWMSEVQALDKMYQMQEDEWRAKKRAAKNKKEQPEEPKLPVRCLTLNNTVANLAERLANTEGKHAFSFTPEADTVAQKWKSTMSDFSVMLRQSYDGTKYEREARSADAVNVHIDKLL